MVIPVAYMHAHHAVRQRDSYSTEFTEVELILCA